MNQQSPIVIRKIKEISFFINETGIVPNSQRVIKIEIGQKLRFAIEDNLIELVIFIVYFYEDSPKNKLSEISVQNIFEIPGLKNYQVGVSEIKLPPELISTAFQSAIAHTRALMAAHLFGTPLEFHVTGLVDGAQIAKYFYPNMFGAGERSIRP